MTYQVVCWLRLGDLQGVSWSGVGVQSDWIFSMAREGYPGWGTGQLCGKFVG